MERYSLLKINPALLSALKPKSQQNLSLKGSLYSLLDSSEHVKGLRVRMNDFKCSKEYVVERYERYKAGLMGRVWLKRADQANDSAQSRLVSDLEAMGVKWQIVKEQ